MEEIKIDCVYNYKGSTHRQNHFLLKIHSFLPVWIASLQHKLHHIDKSKKEQKNFRMSPLSAKSGWSSLLLFEGYFHFLSQ